MGAQSQVHCKACKICQTRKCVDVQMRMLTGGLLGMLEAGGAGQGLISLLFIKDNSWSGISARTSLASRAILRIWFPERSM